MTGFGAVSGKPEAIGLLDVPAAPTVSEAWDALGTVLAPAIFLERFEPGPPRACESISRSFLRTRTWLLPLNPGALGNQASGTLAVRTVNGCP